jgi:predicted AAA+ superfamily ATPase
MTHMYKRILKQKCATILQNKSLLLLGPRQVGKSTLIKTLQPDLTINLAKQTEYLDHLKDPSLLERLIPHAKKPFLVFIDEVQRIPDMLNTVQAIIDEAPQIHFALTGSSARKLKRGQANLLPGRVVFEKLYPITFWEISQKLEKNFLETLLIKGSLPGVLESNLADEILETYVDIYLREEIQAEALTKDLGDYSRFVNLSAETSGQFLNYNKLASESEIHKEKIRRYFDILLDTLLIHRIESYGTLSQNRKARQKDRFIYFDNGVQNGLLRKNRNQFSATDLGPLFEQWIFQQIIALNQYQKRLWRVSSYRDDRNLKVDLIIETKKRTFICEIKYQPKYRSDFGAGLDEFRRLKNEKDIIPIVIYCGSRIQKGQFDERVMPVSDFLHFIADQE